MSTPDLSPTAIRAWRLAAKLSQGALADRLGVNRTTVTGWETGKTVPSDLMATALADMMQHQPTRGRVRPIAARPAPAGEDPWAAGVRHAVLTIMRTLSDLSEQANAADESERADVAAIEREAIAALLPGTATPQSPPARPASARAGRRRSKG